MKGPNTGEQGSLGGAQPCPAPAPDWSFSNPSAQGGPLELGQLPRSPRPGRLAAGALASSRLHPVQPPCCTGKLPFSQSHVSRFVASQVHPGAHMGTPRSPDLPRRCDCTDHAAHSRPACVGAATLLVFLPFTLLSFCFSGCHFIYFTLL